MSLFRLVYASRLSPDCHLDDLAEIANVSRKNNPEKGITGCLCYSLNGFLQVLEGSSVAVNEIFRRIVRDTRHGDVTLLDYSPIPQREFERWSMAYVRSEDVDALLLQKYSSGTGFRPFEMTAEQAVLFMRAVTEKQAAFLTRQQEVSCGGAPTL